jgi:hypothetical protein
MIEGVELQYQRAANQAFESLIDDVRLGFDPKDGKLTFRTMLMSGDKLADTSSAIGLTGDLGHPVKLRYEFVWPKVEGTTPSGSFKFYGTTIKAVVELTVAPVPPKGPAPGLSKDSQDSRLMAHQSDRKRFTIWEKLAGVGLAGAATVVVFATLVEDYLTMGAGIGDDAPSMALASGMLALALEKLRHVPTEALPQADMPASLNARLQFGSPDM